MRQRERLAEYAAAHIQPLQKALIEMNLQLHHVVSDITGATGMRIIRAIVGGERDPEVLAAFQDIRCKSSMETIKAELIWRRSCETRRQAEITIFEYINGFYNPRRRHSALGWKNPVAFERKVA